MKMRTRLRLLAALASSAGCDTEPLLNNPDTGPSCYTVDAETVVPTPADAGTVSDAELAHPVAQEAAAAILAAFDRYPVVGGMSAGHGNQEVDEFLLALLRHPSLPDKVNDIAVECGNVRYQDVLDRYIAGDQVPLEDVRRVWRDTTQPECGFSSFYAQLFPLVRRVNQARGARSKLRVLACDPPIDWSEVHGADYLESPAMDRGAGIARVIQEQVLAKQRKALLLFGVRHLIRGTGSALDRYEQAGYRGVTYVIADHVGFGNHSSRSADNDALEARMAGWPVPGLAAIEGSWLATLDPAYFNADVPTPGQLGYPGVDGYLFVGRRDVLLREPRSAAALLDATYLAELERRANALGEPPDSPMHPQTMIQQELAAAPYGYDPSAHGPGGPAPGP